MQENTLSGIHHVTAICGDPQCNIDFYTKVLGLRLVKVTVNFDDPSSYHFYYGDLTGSPGTILTFFAWPNSQSGKIAAPQATSVAFASQRNSVPEWKSHLEKNGVTVSEIKQRFNQTMISFSDPDGLSLEIIGVDTPDLSKVFHFSRLPNSMLLCGIHSVTLAEFNVENTHKYLSEVMGLAEAARDNNRTRMSFAKEGLGCYVDIVAENNGLRGRIARGNIHHVAFDTPAEKQQLEWLERTRRFGSNVSDVMERCYFQSIYFREPGGILFEIATATPGMVVDESLQNLGTSLCLPPWLEETRAAIEQVVLPISYPSPLSRNSENA